MKKQTLFCGFVCAICVCCVSSAYAGDPKDETPQINFNDSLFVSGSSKDGTTSFSLNNDNLSNWILNFNLALTSKDSDKKTNSERFLEFNKISTSIYFGRKNVYFYCKASDGSKVMPSVIESYRAKISTALIDAFILRANALKSNSGDSNCFSGGSGMSSYADKVFHIINDLLYNASIAEIKEWCSGAGLSDEQCKLILSSKGFIDIKDSYGFSPLSSIVWGLGAYAKHEQLDKSFLVQNDSFSIVNVSDLRDETFSKTGGGAYFFFKSQYGMLSLRGFLDYGKRFKESDFKSARLCEDISSSSSESTIESCKDISIYKGNFDGLSADVGFGYNVSYSVVVKPFDGWFKVSDFEDFLEKKANYNLGAEVRLWGDDVEDNHLRGSVFITPGFADNPLSGRIGVSVDYKFEDESVTPYIYVGGAVF